MRMLSLINRTYGPYSEWLDLQDAFRNNWQYGAGSIATALAFNEAVDRSYGARARLLKRSVYSKSWYRLPVGYDALSNLWRHW